MATPEGSELTFDKLIEALVWKVDNGQDDSDVNHRANGWDENIRIKHNNQVITRRIKGAERILKALYIRHNPLQGINRLPVEILSYIFSLLQVDFRDDFFVESSDIKIPKFHSWLSVTHVCRHWRNCALSAPFLWHSVYLGEGVRDPGSIGSTYLERSHPGPFEFYLKLSSKSPMKQLLQFYDGLNRNLWRIQGVYIFCRKIDKDIFGLLNRNLPSLHSLHINYQVHYDSPGKIDRLDRTAIPALYDGRLDHLKRLSLRIHGTTEVIPDHFSGLTDLDLSLWDLQGRGGTHSPRHKALTLLGFCPLLQRLTIHDVENANKKHFETTQTISLPFLRTVKFIASEESDFDADTELDSFSDSAPLFILHRLNMPPDVNIIFDFGYIYLRGLPSMNTFCFPPPSYLQPVTSLEMNYWCNPTNHNDDAVDFYSLHNRTPSNIMMLHKNKVTFNAYGEESLQVLCQSPRHFSSLKSISLNIDPDHSRRGREWEFARPDFTILTRGCRGVETMYLKGTQKSLTPFWNWLHILDSKHTLYNEVYDLEIPPTLAPDKVKEVEALKGSILPSLKLVQICVLELTSQGQIEEFDDIPEPVGDPSTPPFVTGFSQRERSTGPAFNVDIHISRIEVDTASSM